MPRLAGRFAIALGLMLVTMAVLRGPSGASATWVVVALLVSGAGWVAAMVHGYRGASARLDSRICLARLGAVRAHLAVHAPPATRENAVSLRPGADVLTGRAVYALQSEVRQLEHEIDGLEQRVERALLLGAVSATLGAAALGAAVGASALSFS